VQLTGNSVKAGIAQAAEELQKDFLNGFDDLADSYKIELMDAELLLQRLKACFSSTAFSPSTGEEEDKWCRSFGWEKDLSLFDNCTLTIDGSSNWTLEEKLDDKVSNVISPRAFLYSEPCNTAGNSSEHGLWMAIGV